MPQHKTTRFRKVVITPGKYQIAGQVHDLSRETLEQVAFNGQRLLEKGARIPAPLAHVDENGNMPSPINMSENGGFIDFQTGEAIGWKADLNAGWVDGFEYGTLEDPETGESVEGLIADFEIDGDAEDADSIAAKIGNTIRETSGGFRPNFVDSEGEAYEGYTPAHVGLVTSPVEMKQSNFQPIKSDEFAVMMNNTVLMAVPAGSTYNDPEDAKVENDPNAMSGALQLADSPIKELISKLQSVQLSLPDDTTEENLVERLSLILEQKIADLQADSASSDDLTKRPEGGQAPSAPVAMSQNTNQPKLDAADLFFSQVVRTHKEGLRKRAENLIATQRASADWVKKSVLPKIDAINMSVGTLTEEDIEAFKTDAKLPRAAVEDVIEGLESTNARNLTKPAEGSSEPDEGGVPNRPEYDAQNAWEKEQTEDSAFGETKKTAAEEADEWAQI